MLIVDKYRDEMITKILEIPLTKDRWDDEELLMLIYIQIAVWSHFL